MKYTTIGACGYIATGSSAICDLLKEFDETCVIDDFEMMLTYYPDALCDLDWHLNLKYAKECAVVAIARFRTLMRSRMFMRQCDKEALTQIADEFIKKIVSVKWRGLAIEDGGSKSWFFRWLFGAVVRKFCRLLKTKSLPDIYFRIVGHEIELANRPERFDEAAKEFVDSFLDAQGRDKSRILVLNQPFPGNNPSIAFKYYDNPAAIIVDRDPRDCYLFAKKYLRARGAGLQVACDNVNDFIAWYKAVRTRTTESETANILRIHFEELIYDYENAVKKVSDFCGVSAWVHKGEFFKPTHSRTNTQLFKKFSGYDEDIAIIERDLADHIFHFEDYPDVIAEGHMFMGSQGRKR